ncbi:polysaccharide deacetylase family protein [Derxia gummosa]|uniref:Polysaccharide deacetylase family protein n=1 Tax=Derxia gummosa DSM 723 TaxID=1121388 RepID=A0A8B6X503_9BURK|nr:polysaccharide deacetylase family protein [Derxia gummosa]
MTTPAHAPLPRHDRFDYTPIHRRPDFCWPGGARLAVYVAVNHEHFAFGAGLGARLAPGTEPDVLNHAWREYGNRVGAWRLMALLDQLGLPAAALLNTALYDHCPELVAACVARGDELVAHGHTNADNQSALAPEAEAALLAACRARIAAESGRAPEGWLSPWIAETPRTPDLLAAAGYRYTLNWCHDDQPTRLRTAAGPLWAIPYPQEANDIPAVIARQMTGAQFAELLADQFDEMREQSAHQPLVMGIALHPYLVGQPHRLRPLRRVLARIAAADDVWLTTPGRIAAHMDALAAEGGWPL